jgi:hypothetical protein
MFEYRRNKSLLSASKMLWYRFRMMGLSSRRRGSFTSHFNGVKARRFACLQKRLAGFTRVVELVLDTKV